MDTNETLPVALYASLMRGLAQSAHNDTIDLGNFSQHANNQIENEPVSTT